MTTIKQVSLAPGDTIGILGGGQLGRMLALAAARLGLKAQVYSPDPDSPAFDVVQNATCAEYADVEALELFAADVNVVTYEFENVPAATAMVLAARRPVLPDTRVLETTQDRLAEKNFVTGLGLAATRYAEVSSAADLRAAVAAIGLPAVLKTRRFGYDGKGQVRVASHDEARQAFEALRGVPCILEALQPLDYEISVVVARDLRGRAVSYAPSRNTHRDGILALSVADGSVPEGIANLARGHALSLADHLDYHGVLCVEFFVLRDGRVLANEMAPRPHNSGHYTQDGCLVSQFEQQARIMAGLPLGETAMLRPAAMLNLLGDLWFDAQGRQREPDWVGVLDVPGTRLHLYAKSEARRGRKMGHVNILGADAAQLRERIARVSAVLGLPHA